MAQFILTYPDPWGPRVRDALCANFGYQDTVDDAPNPESRTDFARRMLAEWLKSQVAAHESRQAARDVIAAAEADVRENLIVT